MLKAYTPCKNCRKPTHPTYIRKYHGFCLECSNAGVDELLAAMDQLKAEVERLKAEIDRLKAGLRELSGVDVLLARIRELEGRLKSQLDGRLDEVDRLTAVLCKIALLDGDTAYDGDGEALALRTIREAKK